MLGRLFRQIDRIYDLDLGVNIEDFLISQETCRLLSGQAASSAVVVRQDGEGEELQLGVYIGEETLSRLRDMEEGEQRLEPQNLEAVFTAIEEVSHFAYLLWNAHRDKKVTQLELELQGEVDKFVTSTLWMARQNAGLVPADWIDTLFERFVLRDGLDRSERERYRAASAFARSYCSVLLKRFLRPARVDDLLADLRRFYRLTQGGKIRHIYRAALTS